MRFLILIADAVILALIAFFLTWIYVKGQDSVSKKGKGVKKNGKRSSKNS